MLGKLAMPDFCPRCFRIEMRCEKIPFALPMPGIFSSIDAYEKNVVHAFMDKRGMLPPWFPNVGLVVNYVRGLHHSAFNFTDDATGMTLTGVPDDILELKGGSYAIVDYKTARFTERQDALLPLYEVQLNAYAWVARHTGLSPISSLSLIYMEPKTGLDGWEQCVSDTHFSLRFSATLKPVTLHEDDFILSLLKKARRILDEYPSPREGCQNCRVLGDFLEKIKESDFSKPF